MPRGLRGDDLTLPVRVAQVATLWVLLERVFGPDAAFKRIGGRAGRQLDPVMTDALIRKLPNC